MSERFYWLKLERDFFKRHDIQIIESMQNGKDYILFYLKLLCESIDHEGSLRFNDNIPYNEEMLSIITRTNIDIVRAAIKVFTNLKMMEILDDGTIYMNAVNKMIGSAVNNDNANRQRRFREKQKELLLQERYDSVTNNNESKSIEKELEKDIDTFNKAKVFTPPTIDEITQYCKERNNNISPQAFFDFYESKNWMIGKNKMKNWKAAIRTWENQRKGLTTYATSPSSNKTSITVPDWYNDYKNDLNKIDKEKVQEDIDLEKAAKELFGD